MCVCVNNLTKFALETVVAGIEPAISEDTRNAC